MQTQCKQPTAYRAALGVALAAGFVAVPSFAHAATAGNANGKHQELPGKKIEAQVSAAELAVLKSPQGVSVRSRLAQSYLAAGRFESAAVTFEDAIALGDQTASTALGMALSYIAMNRNVEAATLLEHWSKDIPAGDLGLAMAISGQPAQAITVLGNAIAQGHNSPTMRQNLAYAYALAGHLREARMIAAQDVPADKLDARVSEWALAASLGSPQLRVATLLGAPVRTDPGRSVQLALITPAVKPALAMVEQASLASSTEAELPALAEAVPLAPQFAQVSAPVQDAGTKMVQSARQSNPEMADIADALRRYKEKNTAQVAVAKKAPSPAIAAVRQREERRQAAVASSRTTPKGKHVVQLGSFTTEAGARRAWNIFVSRDPSLANRELRITQAMVNGRRYFRVAAGGYEALEARRKCSSLRGRGTDCLARVDVSSKRGPVPQKALAPTLARS